MKDFIIIDIETTGLSPKQGCEITEIAAIRVDGKSLEIKDKYETLVKINKSVPYFITNLTGITDSMLKNGKKITQALTELSEFCKDLDIYAHNAPFDKGFIRHYLEEHEVTYTETNWVDTISIFRQKFPGRKTYKLESLIIDYKLAEKEDHRALSDAMYTLELLRK